MTIPDMGLICQKRILLQKIKGFGMVDLVRIMAIGGVVAELAHRAILYCGGTMTIGRMSKVWSLNTLWYTNDITNVVY